MELDFNAKRSIREDYDAKMEVVSDRIKKILALPVLTLVPNFSTNFATITASELAAKGHDGRSGLWDHEWQKHIGVLTLQYFSEFADYLSMPDLGRMICCKRGLRRLLRRMRLR